MRHAIVIEGILSEVNPRKIVDRRGIKHPRDILTKWTEAELNAIDIYEITDGTYDAFEFNKIGSTFELVAGKAVETITTEATPVKDMKARELANVYAEYEQAMDLLKNGYTNSERETWRKQEEEARAYVADNLSPTPFIDGLIAAGVAGDRAAIANKIITKADALVISSATPTGIKQRKEDAINAIDDIAGTAQEVRDAIQ